MSQIYRLLGLECHQGTRRVLWVDDLQINSGEIVGITGDNGSGKSTLLAVMSFLRKCDNGQVVFRGETVEELKPDLRRLAVLLPQDACLLRRRVWDNVIYGLTARGRKDPEAARLAMDMAGLDHASFARRWWWELSGGEARRVALAARLAVSPMVLLLDEPTANLDGESAKLVRQAVLAQSAKAEKATVVVSHDQVWLESFVTALYRLTPDKGLVKPSVGH